MASKLMITSKEILKEQIEKTRKELPLNLTTKDLVRLLPHSKSKIYDMLRKYDYPEHDPNDVIPNRKAGGKRWVPRDWFLAWYYGDTEKKIVEEVEYEVEI